MSSLTELERELYAALVGLFDAVNADARVKKGDYYHERRAAAAAIVKADWAKPARAEAKAKQPQCKCEIGSDKQLCGRAFESTPGMYDCCVNPDPANPTFGCEHARACHLGSQG